MGSSKVNIGIIGCGNISSVYLDVCKRFGILNMVACSDIVEERARAKAKEFNIPKVYSVDKLLADPDIDIVLNLTIPQVHSEIGIAALKAGKHIYNEKPLTVKLDDAKKMLRIAEEKRLLVGCAPDTFLGGGLQTCRKIIDDGLIGEPIACTCFMITHGSENWHPDPENHYKLGGDPMFNMGPYYLTAMINLIGPIRSVTGSSRITFPERIITSKPKYGQRIKVEVPTHIVGVMDFYNGVIGTIITSYDIWATQLPKIEIYGSEGTLSVPDPNTFGGPVRICHANSNDWKDMPLTYGYIGQSRGIGLADIAYAIQSGRQHRANSQMAYHILEIMGALLQAGKDKKYINITSTCERPAPLPIGLEDGVLD